MRVCCVCTCVFCVCCMKCMILCYNYVGELIWTQLVVQIQLLNITMTIPLFRLLGHMKERCCYLWFIRLSTSIANASRVTWLYLETSHLMFLSGLSISDICATFDYWAMVDLYCKLSDPKGQWNGFYSYSLFHYLVASWRCGIALVWGLLWLHGQ